MLKISLFSDYLFRLHKNYHQVRSDDSESKMAFSFMIGPVRRCHLDSYLYSFKTRYVLFSVIIFTDFNSSVLLLLVWYFPQLITLWFGNFYRKISGQRHRSHRILMSKVHEMSTKTMECRSKTTEWSTRLRNSDQRPRN